MEATTQTRKNLAALSIISTIAVILFTVPLLLGKEISPSLLISALILVSVYVILYLEIIHRTSVSLLGAIIIPLAFYSE
ncbi:MAG: hypothetical protein ACR2IS_12605 [Nitrososphaeraceae archaeon]